MGRCTIWEVHSAPGSGSSKKAPQSQDTTEHTIPYRTTRWDLILLTVLLAEPRNKAKEQGCLLHLWAPSTKLSMTPTLFFGGPGPLTSQCNPSIGTPSLMPISRTSTPLLYSTLSMMRLASGWRRNWDILRCLFLSPAILIPVDHIHDFAKLHSQKQKATHISLPKRLFLLSLLHV